MILAEHYWPFLQKGKILLTFLRIFCEQLNSIFAKNGPKETKCYSRELQVLHHTQKWCNLWLKIWEKMHIGGQHATMSSTFASRPSCHGFVSQPSQKIFTGNICWLINGAFSGKWTMVWKCWLNSRNSCFRKASTTKNVYFCTNFCYKSGNGQILFFQVTSAKPRSC